MRKITLTILNLLPFALLAQQKLLPVDSHVRIGKLANGFTYYIRHNEEPKKRVVFYLANKVGSVLENDDQRGLAHFIEHMSFNGTKNFPRNELVNYLQKSGVRFGADLNAYTNFDETVYQLPLPADNSEVLKNGIQIMRDWAQDALLDPAGIDKERGVVLEEKRLGKGAQERMQRLYWPMLLNNSRYAVRIPIGVDTVLTNFKPRTIKRFYQDWYRPDLQALIVVGDINVDQMEKTIKEKFSDLKNPKQEKVRTNHIVPLSGRNQFIAVTDPEMSATVAEILIKLPGLKLRTIAEYRQSIIRRLYNSMLGQRLAELSRKPSPHFIQIGANVGSFFGGIDCFNASLVSKPGELENGLKAVWRETERARKFGFTPTELERAKKDYQNQFESMLKEKGKTNSENYVKEYLDHFLHGTAAPGIDYEYQLVKTDLPSITLNDVNALAKAAIKNIDRDILVMAPEKDKASLPNQSMVNAWLMEVQAEVLNPYVDQINTQGLLTSQPIPGKITEEILDTALNITTIRLSNGVKIFLKPTTYKDNEILFNSFSTGGTSLYSNAEFQSAANAAMIAGFGVGNYNPSQLDQFLSGKRLSVNPYIGERTQGIIGSSEPKDIVTAFQLIYAYYTQPRKDTALFHSSIERFKASLVNRNNDPQNLFRDTVSAILGNYNVRRTGPTSAKLDQINMDRAYQIYLERFADASGLSFTLVGRIDIPTIKPLLEKYIGALPNIGKHEQAKDLGIHIPSGKISKTVYKGFEQKATVDLVWSGVYNYSPANNISLDALKECLEIRLLERLREDESGVYSPAVFAQIIKYPQNRFAFIVQFGCAPQNVDKLIASTLDEVNKLKINGPSQVNIAKWRAESQRGRETEVQTNQWWLDYLNKQLQNKENLSELNDYPAQLEKVTQDDLKKDALQYLSGDNYIRLVLLPETNIKSK